MDNKINKIPPIFSHFQETINKIVKINEGIKCINKATKTRGKEYSEKTSRANILIKRINMIVKILGNQNKNLFIFYNYILEVYKSLYMS